VRCRQTDVTAAAARRLTPAIVSSLRVGVTDKAGLMEAINLLRCTPAPSVFLGILL
jgi:hypothetical protein